MLYDGLHELSSAVPQSYLIVPEEAHNIKILVKPQYSKRVKNISRLDWSIEELFVSKLDVLL